MNRPKDQVPRLFFPAESSDYLEYGELPTVYRVTEGDLPDLVTATRLRLVVAEFSVDGQFIGYHPVERGRIQLCQDTVNRLDAAYDIGVDYRQRVIYVSLSLSLSLSLSPV